MWKNWGTVLTHTDGNLKRITADLDKEGHEMSGSRSSMMWRRLRGPSYR